MTNAQRLARDCALDILKAYNSKIFQSVATPEQRERAQAAAYVAAEAHVRKIGNAVQVVEGVGSLHDWLNQKAKDET